MFKTITLWSLVLLCFFSGCARQTYLFPVTTGASVAYQKARQQQEPVNTSTFSLADGEAGPALASLEALPIEKYQPSSEARALVKHLSGEIKGDGKAAGAPHHPVAVGDNKSGPDKKLPYKQKKATKLGKASFILGLAGVAFLLLATVVPVFVFLGFFAALLGTIISIPILTDVTRGPKNLKDRRKAKAGLILGLITVVLSLILSLNRNQW
jgi:hypothetical protein